MSSGVGEVFIVNPGTGEYMFADHYALLEHGMPNGYETVDGMGHGDWLDAIARAVGREPLGLPDTDVEHEVMVDLRSGASASIHKAVSGEHGLGEGWTRIDEVDTLDLLDALRAVHGSEPCERPGSGDLTTRSP